jgi:superfamily II DNA or RNA helicase
LSSRKAICLTQSLLRFDEGTLSLNHWNRQAIERVFGLGFWTWDLRSQIWRTHASNYNQIISHFSKSTYGTVDQVSEWQKINFSPDNQLPVLRDEQNAAIEAWSADKRGMVIMPTGTGKTEVALRILANEQCSTLVVAPIRDLMYQWHRRILKGLGYDAGIIGDNTFNLKPISVTTYDSACIHAPKLGNRFKLVVFDECHHLPGPIRGDAARMFASPMRLGLTATLEESDRRFDELQALIGPTAYRLAIGDVKGHSLADYDIFRIKVKLSEREQTRYDTLAKQVSDYVYERRQEDDHFDWNQLCKESSADVDARSNRSKTKRMQSSKSLRTY